MTDRKEKVQKTKPAGSKGKHNQRQVKGYKEREGEKSY